ncbi:NmrA family NAD(P)-binding protein [Actinosynnema sp. NPDC020468]|uniref:NmrA family NAD(P)-binding protein n=1 Tax=Actinosynnema sp. NPDC020468 TaxID=3154488 RepID=UPI0033D42F79
MILVIGGTGTVGAALLPRLAAHPAPVTALVRTRPAHPVPGVRYLVGDAGEPNALRTALTGAEQVFLAMGNGPRQRELELAVVDASARAGVHHLVKLSAPATDTVAVARLHRDVEHAVVAARIDHTFLRPYAFHQNLLRLAPMIAHTGMFTGTTGDHPLNMVDARDIADVATVALTTTSTRGQSLVLTGPEALSYPQVADLLTSLGRPTRYVDLPPERLRHDLDRMGQPSWLVDHILEIQNLTRTHRETPTTAVRAVTGHEPRGLADFLREHLPAFTSQGAARPGGERPITTT